MRIAMKWLGVFLWISAWSLGQVGVKPPIPNYGVGSFLNGTGASIASYGATTWLGCSATKYTLVSEQKYAWVTCSIHDWLTDQHLQADARVPTMYVKVTGNSVVVDIPDLKAAWEAAYHGGDDISFYANNGFPEPISVHLTYLATNDWSQLWTNKWRQRYIDEATGREVISTGQSDSLQTSATATGTFAGYKLPLTNPWEWNDISFNTGTLNKNHTTP